MPRDSGLTLAEFHVDQKAYGIFKGLIDSSFWSILVEEKKNELKEKLNYGR